LQAGDGLSPESVALSWQAAETALGYEVWRAAASDVDSGAPVPAAIRVGATAGTAFADSSADPGVYYTYWVAATNRGGPSAFSAPDSGWRRHPAGVLAADYDGDRLADPAIYAEESGSWAVRLSGNQYALLAKPGFLGGPGWVPASGDYDGDGRADPAVYRASGGDWRVLRSGSGYASLSLAGYLGGPGFSACPADYDGDGLTDPAVCQDLNGDWLIRVSGSGYSLLTAAGLLGGPAAVPCPADYDGDGKADPAVCRGDGGEWRLRPSGNGYALRIVNLTW